MPANQVTNIHTGEQTTPFEALFKFDGLETGFASQFAGHLNAKGGDNFHFAGQGKTNDGLILENSLNGGSGEGEELQGLILTAINQGFDVNFVLNEHTQNVVARTDYGTLHFNNHSDNFSIITDPGLFL